MSIIDLIIIWITVAAVVGISFYAGFFVGRFTKERSSK